jgi:hypothetical protein
MLLPDSTQLIGTPERRFACLIRKEYDWRSFYNGWLEGRAELIREINDGGISTGKIKDGKVELDEKESHIDWI